MSAVAQRGAEPVPVGGPQPQCPVPHCGQPWHEFSQPLDISASIPYHGQPNVKYFGVSVQCRNGHQFQVIKTVREAGRCDRIELGDRLEDGGI